MHRFTSLSTSAMLTIAALLAAALGFAIQIAAGVEVRRCTRLCKE